MHIALIGSGKIGEAIVTLFNTFGKYTITVVDKDEARLAPMKALGCNVLIADVANDDLASKLKGVEVVLSACPFYLTPVLAKLAKTLNAHYFDLTEDVAST
ncbi:MAG: saccharopine dehydrogenase NADP-binding domain-containing protein, partial [Burkholderiales bacterium]